MQLVSVWTNIYSKSQIIPTDWTIRNIYSEPKSQNIEINVTKCNRKEIREQNQIRKSSDIEIIKQNIKYIYYIL